MALWPQDQVALPLGENAVALIAQDELGMYADGVAPDPLTVELDGPGPTHWLAYDAHAGGWQAGFAGTIVAAGNGWAVTINVFPAPLAAGAWTVTVYAEDWSGAPGGGSWSFLINNPPTATWTAPAGPGILPGASISGTTSDPDDGIDPSKTSVTLTPPAGPAELAVIGGAVQAGYTGTCTAAGFSITKDGGMTQGSWSGVLHCEDFAGASNNSNGAWTVDDPPTILGTGPVGIVPPDSAISYVSADTDDGDVLATHHLALTPPVGAPVDALLAGAWQPGYGGVTLANGSGGHDVTCNTHPVMMEGAWTAEATCQDVAGADARKPGGGPLVPPDPWSWTVEWSPKLTGGRATARRKITLAFDMTVRLRAVTKNAMTPPDRYTPVDWVGTGGNTSDAFNPANYAITRPAGGALDGPAEAVDLTVVSVEEPETGVTEESGFRVADSVVLVVDFEQTATAGYRVQVSNIVHTTGAIDPAFDTFDFTGHVVSSVSRSSLHLFDILPAIARRLDQEGTGDLALFCTAFQEVFDRFTEDLDVFYEELCSLDYIRDEFVDALLYDLGDQFSELFALTANEKRRLAKSLVRLYKLKGTCPGIVQVVDFFLGITIAGCRSGWDDCWRLAKGAYPVPVYPHPGETYPLSKGAYPAPAGGAAILGPVGAEIWAFWLLHAAPGALTPDQVSKIAALVDLWKPNYARYLGITTP